MASGRPERAEQILKTISLTNKHALPPGKLLDVNARVSFEKNKKIISSFSNI